MSGAPRVLVVGAGMIAADLILPSLLHLRRARRVGEITVCARGTRSLRELKENRRIREAFPDLSFACRPDPSAAAEQQPADACAEAIAGMPPRQVVVVAVPDQAHHEVIMQALRADQHVICVKPLVLLHGQAREIAQEARERGLFVGVEYHKRFDRRSLLARRDYRAGRFGEFRFGEARLIEPYFYRRSNFQTWFQPENTDPFAYVGCHYVDLVHFITGLRPTEVSVSAVSGRFPNGRAGLMWSLASVRWENDALLSVANGLGYPDAAAGSNDQGLVMYCEGPESSGMIRHDDHDRGVAHSYVTPEDGGAAYRHPSPDFFRLVPREGGGLRPIGYGYESIEALVEAVHRVEAGRDVAQRRATLEQIDAEGFLVTAATSIDALVGEAGRLSIRNGGRTATIAYGAAPGASLR